MVAILCTLAEVISCPIGSLNYVDNIYRVCYWIVPTTEVAKAIDAECGTNDGKIAFIPSSLAMESLKAYLVESGFQSGDMFHIGLEFIDGHVYIWESTTSPQWMPFWATGQPDSTSEGCIAISMDGNMSDVKCSQKLYGVCSIHASYTSEVNESTLSTTTSTSTSSATTSESSSPSTLLYTTLESSSSPSTSTSSSTTSESSSPSTLITSTPFFTPSTSTGELTTSVVRVTPTDYLTTTQLTSTMPDSTTKTSSSAPVNNISTPQASVANPVSSNQEMCYGMNLCLCPCLLATYSCRLTNLTDTVILDFLEEYRELVHKEMLLDKKTLSATMRRLTSAQDSRPTSKVMGSIGGIIISVIVLAVVMSDVTSFFRIITSHWTCLCHHGCCELKNPFK